MSYSGLEIPDAVCACGRQFKLAEGRPTQCPTCIASVRDALEEGPRGRLNRSVVSASCTCGRELRSSAPVGTYEPCPCAARDLSVRGLDRAGAFARLRREADVLDADHGLSFLFRALDDGQRELSVCAGTLAETQRRLSAAVPMLLWCPQCRERHVDAGPFAIKHHHTHVCQSCGMVWRPAVGPTVGVQFLPGFRDGEIASG